MPGFAKAQPRPLEKVTTKRTKPDILSRHPGLLGKLANETAETLRKKGWRGLVEEKRGRSAMNPGVGELPHEAAATLDFLRRHGAPVHTSDPPKTPAELQAAADRGPHPSARVHQEFLWEEVLDMCKRRHTMVLPMSVVKRIKGARVSPPGVIPPGPLPSAPPNLPSGSALGAGIHRQGRRLRRVLQYLCERRRGQEVWHHPAHA